MLKIFQFFKKEYKVGKNIMNKDITEFYFTYSSTTFPPHFQRFLLKIENEISSLCYERREGTTLPLTSEHIVEHKKLILQKEELDQFISLLKNGVVTKRVISKAAGGRGPYLYLYWRKDHGIYQHYRFENREKQVRFESYCKDLLNIQ